MLLSDVWGLSVCLSVAYIGPNSRTERPRKTKIGTEVAHVTMTLSRSKDQRSRSPGHFDWLFKSPHNLFRCQQFICHSPESPLARGGGIFRRPPAQLVTQRNESRVCLEKLKSQHGRRKRGHAGDLTPQLFMWGY